MLQQFVSSTMATERITGAMHCYGLQWARQEYMNGRTTKVVTSPSTTENTSNQGNMYLHHSLSSTNPINTSTHTSTIMSVIMYTSYSGSVATSIIYMNKKIPIHKTDCS